MPMKMITVSLPDDCAADLEARVAAGEYDSLDEAVTVAIAERLALLEEPPPFGENVAELRAKIRESIEQYELGRSVDGEEFMARLERESEEEMAGAVKAS